MQYKCLLILLLLMKIAIKLQVAVMLSMFIVKIYQHRMELAL